MTNMPFNEGPNLLRVMDMKRFNYTASDADGAHRCGQVSAADRAAAVREIRALNLLPISVEAAALDQKMRVPAARLLRVGVFVVVGCGLLATLYLLLRPKPVSPPEVTRVDAPGHATAVSVARQESPSVAEVTQPQTAQTAEVPARQPEIPLSTDPAHSVQPSAPPVKPTVDQEQAVAKPPLPKSPYNSLSESALAMIVSVSPGMRVPPLPLVSDLTEDFQGAMTNTILIYADDSEQTALQKDSVALMKESVAEWVREGSSPADVIRAVSELHNEDAQVREELDGYLRSLRAKGVERDILDFMEEANKELDLRGLPRLELRSTTMEERKAMRENR